MIKNCKHYFASFFVIISFIKTITCTTHINQPITFNYFEHKPITDKWAERVASAHVRARTIEMIPTPTRSWKTQISSAGEC